MPVHELPISDYDELPAGSVESRAKALNQQGVQELLDYERHHANRVQIIQLLEHRLESLRSGEATPSGGDPAAPSPAASPGEPGASPVTPQTEGPPQNPPSQGVPTNPAQPRT
ncbi:hypothetical protein [Nocardioides sp.]|uniref:hypothetical protein n=1 Tax=Nocardioides sp. TaxID=35761 RepID=UPI002732AB4F|nr:hypothetical protein [Nocardioides sp.]MDP3892309.1 hypothetical protein [Nocardioides sp.]